MLRRLFFGICLGVSQAGMLQGQDAGLHLPVDAAQPRASLSARLEDPRGGGFPGAIRLVLSFGPAAAPMAWDLREQYRAHATRRLQSLVLAAAIEPDPGTLVRAVARGSVEERMLACLVLGAFERNGPPDILQVLAGADRTLPLRLAIAALAVAPRGAAAERVAESHRDDPGVVAAALLSGAALACELRPWLLDEGRRRPHSDLVLRGWFLGHLGTGESVPEPVLRAAHAAMAAPATPDAVREAAALLLGSRGLLRAEGTKPSPDLLWHCAAAGMPLHAGPLQEWLGWQPASLDDHPGRLAACHALGHGLEEVVKSMPDWSRVPAVADDIALALAMQLARGGDSLPSVPAPVGSSQPCLSWVHWAAGRGEPPRTGSGDALLDAAAALAAAGRLPRSAAAGVLEDALWMRGTHPRLAVRSARLRLVRDLLLSGSNAGARYLPDVPLHERYAPRDLPRDAHWFEVAVPAWNELSPRALPMPGQHRLH